MRINSIAKQIGLLTLLFIVMAVNAQAHGNEVKIKGTLEIKCDKIESEDGIHKCDPAAAHNNEIILIEDKTGETYVLEPNEKQENRVKLLNMGLDHASMMAMMHLFIVEYFTGIKLPEMDGLKFKTSYDYISADMNGKKAVVKGFARKENGVNILEVKNIDIEGAGTEMHHYGAGK